MQARSWTSGLEGAYFAYGQPLAALGIIYSFSGTLSEPLEGAPQRHEPAQVGKVYPKPPCCSPLGDANGVRLPWAA